MRSFKDRGVCRLEAIVGLTLMFLLLSSLGFPSAEKILSSPEEGEEEELIRCNFMPEPHRPGAAEANEFIAAARSAAESPEGAVPEAFCGVEESLTPDGAVVIRYKSLACGSVCVVSREEEWREKNVSTPSARKFYLKREQLYLYSCYDPAYGSEGGPYSAHAPAYPSRITTRAFHDSSAWLCCGGETFAHTDGDVHQILEYVYDLHWCVNRVDGENGEDRGVVRLASTETRRRMQLCSQPDASYSLCDAGDTATCSGDVQFTPQECFPDETDRGEFCYLSQPVSACNEPLEDGEDPSVYDDDEAVTLHVFAFDGFENPGVNQEWAETIGGSRSVNPDVRIDWHLFTQDRIAPALERLVNLSRLYPQDHFATAGFSWGGHSAIKLAKRARRRGVSLELGFSCDPVPHSLVLPMQRPANVGVWWNVYQQAGVPSGRTVGGADQNENVTSIYRSYNHPHMGLGRRCDNGGGETHLTLEAMIDAFLAGLP